MPILHVPQRRSSPRFTSDCLLRTVAMDDLHFVPGLAQSLVHILGNHHGPVLSAGASEADRQVALTLVNIMRKKINQQFGNSVDKFLCLREGTNVLGDPRITSG